MTLSLVNLLDDRSVEDIVLNPRGLSWCTAGRWTGPLEADECQTSALAQLARHVAEQASATLGLTQPSVDAFLKTERATFRAHVVIPPLVLEGPEITLRRVPEANRFSLDDFREARAGLKDRLAHAFERGDSVLTAGATGSGKTSLLTALLRRLPETERVLILEDSPELPLPNRLSTKLVARTDRFGFRSGATWDLSHLVFEALRMRPSRIVLGECRGPEASAIETALMTGHGGLLATIHAGSCAQALERFETLAAAARAKGSAAVSASHLWHLVVLVRCDDDGQRVIEDVLETGASS